MPLTLSEIEAFGRSLAEARRDGQPSDQIDLRRLSSMDEAEAVQAAAIRHFDGTQVGYALAGTSRLCARLLCCGQPVVAPLLREAILDDGSGYRLPRGTIGAGAGFTFVLGRPFPCSDEEALTEANAAEACLACHLNLHLLGRRVPHVMPSNEWSAVADFGLDILHVRDSRIANWRSMDLDETRIALDLDEHEVAQGQGADILGAPIAAVVWLARYLAERGLALNAGDLVATGSCTGLVQVLPGQTVRADFGPLGCLTLKLD